MVADDRKESALGLLSILVTALAALLLIPVTVFVVECLAALLPERPQRWDPDGPRPRTVILVPAHNEASGIGATLASLQAACTEEFSILVVADNCSDDTAQVARDAGADVVERQDAERRGKGYALVFGLDHMAESPPDVVIVVDADCRVSSDALKLIAQKAMATNRPVQADYVLTAPEAHTPLSVVSALAVLVKNRVRPGGLRRLGLPCHLTGSGMAFPYEVMRKAPPTGAYLVEDMLIGIELAKLGHPPMSCSQAEVTSHLPDRDEAAVGQRRRWEHGHLATLLRHGPTLVKDGLQRGSPALVAMGLDLLVPPMALLVILLVMMLFVTLLAGILGAGFTAFGMIFGGLGWVILAVGLAWFAYGRDTLPLKYMATIPAYVAWKIPLYLSFFFKKRQDTWVRTERSSESKTPDTDEEAPAAKDSTTP